MRGHLFGQETVITARAKPKGVVETNRIATFNIEERKLTGRVIMSVNDCGSLCSTRLTSYIKIG
jgi:hypothetical protein